MTKLKAICMTASVDTEGTCLYAFHLPDPTIGWSIRPFITINGKPEAYSVGREYTINLEVTRAEK